jgi:hypothetical protein
MSYEEPRWRKICQPDTRDELEYHYAERFAAAFNAKPSHPRAPREVSLERAGDVWTWMVVNNDSKLIVSYLIGGRVGEYATALVEDLRAALNGSTDDRRPQRISECGQ